MDNVKNWEPAILRHRQGRFENLPPSLGGPRPPSLDTERVPGRPRRWTGLDSKIRLGGVKVGRKSCCGMLAGLRKSQQYPRAGRIPPGHHRPCLHTCVIRQHYHAHLRNIAGCVSYSTRHGLYFNLFYLFYCYFPGSSFDETPPSTRELGSRSLPPVVLPNLNASRAQT